MQDKSSNNTILIVLLTIAAVGGGLYFYNNYIEPRQDGPLVQQSGSPALAGLRAC